MAPACLLLLVMPLQVVLDRMALASLGRLQNFAPLDLRWAALAFATFGPHGPSSKATATTTAAAAGTRAAAGAGSGPALPEWPRVVRGEAAAAATAGAQGAEDVTARRQSRNARVIKVTGCGLERAKSGHGCSRCGIWEVSWVDRVLVASQENRVHPLSRSSATPPTGGPFLIGGPFFISMCGILHSHLHPERQRLIRLLLHFPTNLWSVSSCSPQALCDELAARSGNLALPQPEPRDLALAAHALGLVAAASSSAGGAVAPPALLVKAAGVAARSLPALSGEEAVGLVETLAVWGLRQPALLEALRDAAGRWGEGEQAEALRGRLQAAYTRLGVEL